MMKCTNPAILFSTLSYRLCAASNISAGESTRILWNICVVVVVIDDLPRRRMNQKGLTFSQLFKQFGNRLEYIIIVLFHGPINIFNYFLIWKFGEIVVYNMLGVVLNGRKLLKGFTVKPFLKFNYWFLKWQRWVTAQSRNYECNTSRKYIPKG